MTCQLKEATCVAFAWVQTFDCHGIVYLQQLWMFCTSACQGATHWTTSGAGMTPLLHGSAAINCGRNSLFAFKNTIELKQKYLISKCNNIILSSSSFFFQTLCSPLKALHPHFLTAVRSVNPNRATPSVAWRSHAENTETAWFAIFPRSSLR